MLGLSKTRCSNLKLTLPPYEIKENLITLRLRTTKTRFLGKNGLWNEQSINPEVKWNHQKQQIPPAICQINVGIILFIFHQFYLNR